MQGPVSIVVAHIQTNYSNTCFFLEYISKLCEVLVINIATWNNTCINKFILHTDQSSSPAFSTHYRQ